MFNELKEVKYFKEITDFKRVLKCTIIKKTKTFEKASKSRSVFKNHGSIYGGAFLWIDLTAYYFCNKSFIIDVQLGYIYVNSKQQLPGN